MDFPSTKLPADPGLQDPTDLYRTLRNVEGHVNVRIRHKTAEREPGNRVIDQSGHEIPFYRGFIIALVFSANFRQKESPYI